jgi:hypothetical protein
MTSAEGDEDILESFWGHYSTRARGTHVTVFVQQEHRRAVNTLGIPTEQLTNDVTANGLSTEELRLI